MKGLAATFILFLLIAGHEPPVLLHDQFPSKDTTVAVVPQAVVIPVPDTIITKIKKEEPAVHTGTVSPNAVVQFAKTLIGTRYLYGSTDPKKGFDCSGFITYVFNHFKIKVPRSSVEFTDVGEEINYYTSKPGDLILFTGTDSTIRVVGHMGIVVSNENDKLSFIHSTSGKQYGVTITELSPYYMSRFVRVARVFPSNNDATTPVDHTVEGLNAEPSIKNDLKKPGIKKSSSLTTSKKIDSSITVKSKSTVKKSATKKAPVVKKTPSAKKKSVKKPVTSTKKYTKKSTQTKKITQPTKTTDSKKITPTKKTTQSKVTTPQKKPTQQKKTTSGHTSTKA